MNLVSNLFTKRIVALSMMSLMFAVLPVLAVSSSAAGPHPQCNGGGIYCFYVLQQLPSSSKDDHRVNPNQALTLVAVTTNTLVNRVQFHVTDPTDHSFTTQNLAGKTTNCPATIAGPEVFCATLAPGLNSPSDQLNVKTTFNNRNHAIVIHQDIIRGEIFPAPVYPIGTVAAVIAPIGAFGLFAFSKRTRLMRVFHF